MTGLPRLISVMLLAAVIAITGACSGESTPDNAAKNQAPVSKAKGGSDTARPKPSDNDTILSEVTVYTEVEPGVKPYQTRYIANEHYLRIDDGHDRGGYLLFDRKEKVVYSVVAGVRVMTVVRNSIWQEKLPKQYKVAVKRYIDKNAPLIQGSRVVNLSITVNKKLCVVYQLAPGLLEKTGKAEAAYRAVLASRHYHNIDKTPKEMRDPCFAVTEIFQHSDHLKIGALIRRVTWQKKQKLLVDFKVKQPVKRSLFTLPASYKRRGTVR